MNQKYLSGKILATPIAIVSLIVLIVIGAYLAYAIYRSKQIEKIETPIAITEPSDNSDSSNTSDETANWQEYTNDEYGFSFKYPKDWEINKNAQSNNRELLVAFNVKNYEVAGNGFTIYRSMAEIGMVPSTTIGGKKATKGNRLQGAESQYQSVTVQLDDGSYLKIFVEGTALDDLDQILSTFKFTP